MAGSWLRRHALLLTAVAIGLGVRAVVVVAYRPALVFPDTRSYLQHAREGTLSAVRPSGYSVFLRPFVLLTDSLAPVQLVQHALAVLLAVACYTFLVRRGLPPWGATLAVTPLLLDPLQLVLEHYILSDLLFEVLVVLACLVLLWRRRPGLGEVVAAGLLVGAAALMRGAGSFLLAAFLVAVVCLRVGWVRVVAFAAAAVLPLAAYAVVFHREYGEYALSRAGSRYLYARLAPIVDCHDPQLELPGYERRLCPRQPTGRRPSPDYFMWGSEGPVHLMSPAASFRPPAGMTRRQVLEDLDRRLVAAEPVTYTEAVLEDFARGFVPTRTYEVPGYPAYYWLFANHYWAFDTFIARGGTSPTVLRHVTYDPKAATFMAAYRRFVYLPGPVAALLLLVASAATLGLGRVRRSGHRVAVGLLTVACVVPLLTGALLSGFSWRYQLVQIPLLPMAGALGLAALVRGRAAGQPEPDPPLRILDGVARQLTRLPMPNALRARARRSGDLGLLATAVAVLSGVVAGVVAGLGAVGSGWFLAGPGVLLGAATGVLVAVTLLVSRARSTGRDDAATARQGQVSSGSDRGRTPPSLRW